jgi:hypothetical protein
MRNHPFVLIVRQAHDARGAGTIKKFSVRPERERSEQSKDGAPTIARGKTGILLLLMLVRCARIRAQDERIFLTISH